MESTKVSYKSTELLILIFISHIPLGWYRKHSEDKYDGLWVDTFHVELNHDHFCRDLFTDSTNARHLKLVRDCTDGAFVDDYAKNITSVVCMKCLGTHILKGFECHITSFGRVARVEQSNQVFIFFTFKFPSFSVVFNKLSLNHLNPDQSYKDIREWSAESNWFER